MNKQVDCYQHFVDWDPDCEDFVECLYSSEVIMSHLKDLFGELFPVFVDFLI